MVAAKAAELWTLPPIQVRALMKSATPPQHSSGKASSTSPRLRSWPAAPHLPAPRTQSEENGPTVGSTLQLQRENTTLDKPASCLALSDSRKALLRSHSGRHASAALMGAPTSRLFELSAAEFRTLVLERLQLPLPLTEARCEGCGARLDTRGVHRAACMRAGRVQVRGKAAGTCDGHRLPGSRCHRQEPSENPRLERFR